MSEIPFIGCMLCGERLENVCTHGGFVMLRHKCIHPTGSVTIRMNTFDTKAEAARAWNELNTIHLHRQHPNLLRCKECGCWPMRVVALNGLVRCPLIPCVGSYNMTDDGTWNTANAPAPPLPACPVCGGGEDTVLIEANGLGKQATRHTYQHICDNMMTSASTEAEARMDYIKRMGDLRERLKGD